MKICRNQLCPCGSGKKYKRCHGDLSYRNELNNIPLEVIQNIIKSEWERNLNKKIHGDVKEVITAVVDECRFVASGKKLAYSNKWKVFPDFLGDYLQDLLGKVWGEAQVKRSLNDQHEIVQWRTKFSTHPQHQIKNEHGLIAMDTGAAHAWFRLAYDLYLIEHNADFQKKLLRRLREPISFQGARFEAAVAAIMLASGYELQYADEKKEGKHPEFYATHRETNQILAVEAKSRHRKGILGFEPTQLSVAPDSFNVDGLLDAALNKNTKEPLLIFIELNTPQRVDITSSENLYKELNGIWEKSQEKIWSGGFPAVGVVFYNDATPWYLDESLPADGKANVWASVMWSKNNKHNFNAKSLLKGIAEGCNQRCTVPLDFPDPKQI